MVLEVGPGVTSVKPGDHVIPLYTPECRAVQVLPQPQDQPVHRDPRHPGQGPDARRHQPLLATRARRSSTTWAARPSRTSPCCPRSRWPRSARTRRSTRLLHRLRRHHRRRRGDQHRQGRAGRQRASCSASAASASTSSRARGWSAPTRSSASTSTRRARSGAERFGMTHFVNPKEVERRSRRRTSSS